jgi:hypothetical protein
MELRLHLLETFPARAADGSAVKVRAYERMAPDASLGGDEHWESTGVLEYRLEDGRAVEASGDGTLRIAGSGMSLTPIGASSAA